MSPPSNHTLGICLDPSVHPPDLDYSLKVFSTRGVTLPNGGLLFYHLMWALTQMWRVPNNYRISEAGRLDDPTVSLETLIVPLPNARRRLDLYNLGYVLQAVAERVLETENWHNGLSIGVHSNNAVFRGPFLVISVQPTGIALKGSSGKVKSLTIDPNVLDSKYLKLSAFTGTVVPRAQMCALFFQVQKKILKRSPHSRCTQIEEIGIARIIAPAGHFQMRVAVYEPFRSRKGFTIGNLYDRIQALLKEFASRDRWETFSAKLDTETGEAIARIWVEKVPVLSDGDVGDAGSDIRSA